MFRLLGVADPAHFLHYRYLRKALTDWAGNAPERILDAGCGAGDFTIYLARRFPQAYVLGLDIDEVAIREATEAGQALQLPNVRFQRADLTGTAVPSDLDLVCAIDVLEHIPAQQEVLARLLTALRPGGMAFFHLPVLRPRPVPFARYLGAFQEWAAKEHLAEALTPAVFKSRLTDAGYRVERVTPTFGYYSGEMATSLFNLPYRPSVRNRLLQGLLAVPCRALALLDLLNLDRPRYAVAVEARRPHDATLSPPGATPGS